VGELGQSSSSGRVIAQTVVMSSTGTLVYKEAVEMSGILLGVVGAGMSAMGAIVEATLVLAISPAEM
jgi:hypothetical protein